MILKHFLLIIVINPKCEPLMKLSKNTYQSLCCFVLHYLGRGNCHRLESGSPGVLSVAS